MYHYERLSDSIEIAVSREHTFGIDAVLLAHFAKPKQKEKIIDLGTGCGIIPLLWLREERPLAIHCLDIQKNAFLQVQESIRHNGLHNRLVPHLCDLREMKKEFPAESFSLVTMNPPYKPENTGIESVEESARIARHETCCRIDDVCAAASYLLKYGGRLCICYRPERLTDVIDTMRKFQLEPKRLRFVQDRDGEQPFLFLMESKKGAKPFLRVEPQLMIKKENGKFTAEMLEIYGSYADGYDR